MASVVARRLVPQASKPSVQLVASGTARRFASGRTHDLVASIVARRLASAVSRQLAREDSPLVKQLASAVAARLVGGRGAGAELPAEKEL
ncbi:MAG: hypothetical protein ABW208_20350 [Pyrinomonadaceae bacterium]